MTIPEHLVGRGSQAMKQQVDQKYTPHQVETLVAASVELLDALAWMREGALGWDDVKDAEGRVRRAAKTILRYAAARSQAGVSATPQEGQ